MDFSTQISTKAISFSNKKETLVPKFCYYWNHLWNNFRVAPPCPARELCPHPYLAEYCCPLSPALFVPTRLLRFLWIVHYATLLRQHHYSDRKINLIWSPSPMRIPPMTRTCPIHVTLKLCTARLVMRAACLLPVWCVMCVSASAPCSRASLCVCPTYVCVLPLCASSVCFHCLCVCIYPCVLPLCVLPLCESALLCLSACECVCFCVSASVHLLLGVAASVRVVCVCFCVCACICASASVRVVLLCATSASTHVFCVCNSSTWGRVGWMHEATCVPVSLRVCFCVAVSVCVCVCCVSV